MSEMKNILSTIAVFVFTLLSCNTKPFFEQEHIFAGDSWKRFDFVIFEVPVKKGDVLDFSLTINYYKRFGADLPLNITFYTPEGEMRSRDYDFDLKKTVNKLDAKTGEAVYQKTFNIRKGMSFGKNGNCKIRIEQKLPLYETEGVKSITLKVVKSEY